MSDKPSKTDGLINLAEFPQRNPNPVLRTGVEGDLLYANPAASALLEAMGRTENEPVPPAIRSLAAEAATKTGVAEEEIPDGRGRIYWFDAIRPEGERYVNIYALDISKRKRAEEALRQSNQELEEFNQAMVGRELRMIELKQEINALCAQLGQPPRYPMDEEVQP